MSNSEAQTIVDAIRTLAENHREWARDYRYCSRSNEFTHVAACERDGADARVEGWFAVIG